MDGDIAVVDGRIAGVGGVMKVVKSLNLRAIPGAWAD